MDKITDKDVQDMLTGTQNPDFLRNGLCGKDVSNIDMSDLSLDMLLRLSFDEKTIFSKEQIDKFNPKEILEKGKKIGKQTNSLHQKGYTGKGVGVAIIDSNINTTSSYITSNVNFKNKENSGDEEVHGQTVLSAFLQVAPDANITYYCDNKRDKNRDKNIKEYIQDIIKNENIKIISMSCRIQDENIQKQVDELLKENNVTLIDATNFCKDFSYCYRKNIENEEYLEDFVVSDKYEVLEYLKNGVDNMKRHFGIEGSSDKDYNELISILYSKGKYNKEIEILKQNKDIFCFDNEEEFAKYIKNIRTQELEDDKQVKDISKANGRPLIEVPCGGKTFWSGEGYKYFSTSSVSYTIPQVSALFAIARQVNKDISYEDFVNIARSTSEKISDRLVVSSSSLIGQIEAIKDKKKYNKPKINIMRSGIEATYDIGIAEINKGEEIIDNIPSMQKESSTQER